MAKDTTKNDILDTRAGDLILDLTAQDEDKTTEGVLNLERAKTGSNNITVSWRIDQSVLDWAKDVARKESVKQKKDVHYQKLIVSCFLEKYPLGDK